MKRFFVSLFTAAAIMYSVGVSAQSAVDGDYEVQDWMTVDITESDPGAQQSATNQAVFFGLQEVAVHLKRLENKCTSPNSDGCTDAIIAAEKKASEIVKTQGLSPKQKRAVRRIVDEAITAANVGDTEGVKKIREQLADHERRIGDLEGDVTKLKSKVTAIESGGTVVISSESGSSVADSMDTRRKAVVAQSTADEALRVAKEAKTAADEAKAASAGENSGISKEDFQIVRDAAADAQARADLAQRAAEEAKEAADKALAGSDNANESGDAEALADANRRSDEALTQAKEALAKAEEARENSDGLADQIAALKTDIGALEAKLDKKQDANEVEAGLGYFTTGKIFAPTVGVTYTVRRGDIRLAIGADFGYHFFYDNIEYEPEIRILFNSYFRLGYQFVDWFSAGIGAFSYSAGQPYSDTFGFGAELSARFNWMLTDALGMAVELWGGPTYEWQKVTNPEPPDVGANEIYKSTDQKGGASGAGGLRLTLTF